MTAWSVQTRPSESVSGILEGLCDRLLEVLDSLLAARMLAADAGRDPWDLAISLADLRARGLTSAEVQWLVLKGFVVHQELAGRRSNPRQMLSENSRFIITDEGMAIRDQLRSHAELNLVREFSALGTPVHALPVWHSGRRELWFAGVLVKRFRVPAPSQERILDAFQEEGWVERIDDPLPPASGISPRTRLRTAIRALNRNCVNNRLYFFRDGTGRGVCWRPRSDQKPTLRA